MAMPVSSFDRISSLPDAVLCYILSFLPTKEAAATSTLSKRWIHLWLSVPIVDLDDQSYVGSIESYIRFFRLAHAAIFSRDVAQPIETLRLKCVSSHCAPDINQWVKGAMQRSVRNLELCLPSTINLPSGVFNGRTLVVLELKRLGVNAVSSVGFPSLKVLHLQQVHFSKYQYFIELLSGCPVLEDLRIRCFFGNSLREGDLRSLSKLVRADIASTYIPLSGIYNVEFLSTSKIYPSCYCDPGFHNLTHVELLLAVHEWDRLPEFLNYCPRLQILDIYKRATNPIDSEEWAHPQFVPECLSSHLRTCYLRNCEGWEAELRYAGYIMQNARVLHIMIIWSSYSSNPEAKFQMIKKLSMIPRSSSTCELLFK